MYSEKFKNLVLYVLSSCDYQDGGIKKLNKILYFIDFYFYRNNERFISSGIKYAKADMGPIVDGYKNIFEELVKNEVLERKNIFGTIFHNPKIKCDISLFSAEEIKHVDNVLERYGKLSSVELESISHEQQPWVLTESEGQIIDPDLALLIDDDAIIEEIEIQNESLKKELVALANKV